MPHIKQRQDSGHRKGQHSKSDLNKITRDSFARDNLSGAFAGDENIGGSSGRVKNQSRSTNVKSRQTKHSKQKTPV